MAHEVSPTARALLALETIQNVPGITARQLGDRLGVTERAARRYVAILREAGLPIDSVSGPYGGYQVGRGLRLPPLTFTAAEAVGLVMAVLEGHRPATDPADLVGGALAKIIRVLPDRGGADRPVDPRRHRRPGGLGRTRLRGRDRRVHGARRGAGEPRDDQLADRGLRGRAAAAAGLPAAHRAGTVTTHRGDGRWRSTRGRWCSGTAAGTCCAGRTPGTRGGCCAWTGSCPPSRCPRRSRRRPASTRCASSRSTCRRAGASPSTC